MVSELHYSRSVLQLNMRKHLQPPDHVSVQVNSCGIPFHKLSLFIKISLFNTYLMHAHYICLSLSMYILLDDKKLDQRPLHPNELLFIFFLTCWWQHEANRQTTAVKSAASHLWSLWCWVCFFAIIYKLYISYMWHIWNFV